MLCLVVKSGPLRSSNLVGAHQVNYNNAVSTGLKVGFYLS